MISSSSPGHPSCQPGMVAARADYRVKSRHGVTPKECVEDAKSAVRWLRQNAAKLGVDPNQIVAAGGSAGGHIAACTALTTGLEADGEDTAVSSKPNAMVLFNPVLRMDLPQLWVLWGMTSPWRRRSHPPCISPRTHRRLCCCTARPTGLPPEGEEFMKKSKELGHRAEMFTAEGQGHGFFNRPPWLEKTTQRMDEFLVSIGYLRAEAWRRNAIDDLVSLLLVLAALAAEPLAPGDHTRTLATGGRTRSYIVHVPPKYDPKQPTPVVLAFHGAMTNASIMALSSGLSTKADEAGFIVVYPNGTGKGDVLLVWNSGGFHGPNAEK